MCRPRRSKDALRVRQQLAENPGAMFDGVLSQQEIEQHCMDLGHVWRDRIFTPMVTLWTFLTQVLSADGSCRRAVATVLSFLATTKGLDASHDPSSYCAARQRLPDGLLPKLTRLIAGKLAAKVDPKHLWHGHRVRLVDGSSVQMPDTPPNQKAFPQPSAQKPGCGFPVARIAGLFDLLTGALVDLAIGPLSDSETSLFRRLWQALAPGDIVVGDRLYDSYAHLALLRAGGVHSLCRMHVRRKIDWRTGQPLGKGDRLQVWKKGRRPQWLSPEAFADIADTQPVRVLRYHRPVRGGRSDVITLVTTLVDARQYSKKDIEDLYLSRWEVETDLGHLKTTMQMELLRTRSPEMVTREVWAHLLAYNLIRTLMWDAAVHRNLSPMRLSFKGAVQQVIALWPFSVTAARTRDLRAFYDALLRAIAFHKVPVRPHRNEPRLIKRRRKNYSLMGAPRQECRRTLALKGA